MPETVQFMNCRILRDHKIIKEDLWVRNGIFINPERVFFDERKQADKQIDCGGCIISPGFIELQINGGSGIDFSQNIDHAETGIQHVAKILLQHGVTSFCPTIVTSPKEVYHKITGMVRRRAGGKHGATILGLHMEGPFINKEKKGAHPIECIQEFEQGFDTVTDVYGDLSNIAIVTLAPELKDSKDVINELVKRNIAVAVGHSMADLNAGEAAVVNGATLITHLFNAMLPFHHRDPGLVGLLTSDQIPEGKTVYFGIISDGIHTHPAALRIAFRTHPEGLVLVTDAISAMGLEEGKHNIGQLPIEIRNKRAYIAGTNTLCGSIASMVECIQLFKKATDCSTEFALEVASLHPARALNISDKKGALDFNADADFVMLNNDLEVLSTWIGGECVFMH